MGSLLVSRYYSAHLPPIFEGNMETRMTSGQASRDGYNIRTWAGRLTY